jgi:hypothetical protein
MLAVRVRVRVRVCVRVRVRVRVRGGDLSVNAVSPLVSTASSGLVETTARFDAGADRFIVDTPTPAARKWLVSNLPRSAAWAIVWANLLVEDHNVRLLIIPGLV